MGSEDVIHSFYIPAFRVKADVIPGRYNALWFTATKPGRYHLFCAEYCGTKHSGMIGWVTAMEPADYQAWLGGRHRRRVAGRRRREAVRGSRLQHLPPGTDPQARGPALTGSSARPWSCRAAATVDRRRGLHPRVDPESAGEGRGRLPADHADVPGLVTEEQLLQLIAYVRVARASRRAAGEATPPRDRRRRDTEHHMDTVNYLNDGHGLKSWLLTTDHKRIALLYLVSITVFFFLGGFFAMLIRLELLTPAGDLLSSRDLQQAVHHARRGDGLLLPDPVDPGGARQLPDPDHDRREGPGVPAHQPAQLVHLHPRRRSSRWWRRSAAASTPAGRSTRPTARRPRTRTSSPPALGVFITGFSSILTGLNFIVTIHRMRAPGLTWFRLPLFVWAHYATSLIMILGTPVLAITVLLVAAERVLHLGHLRPGARRRPGPLPAPVLVLLAPGGLHHDPAGDGRHQRDRRRRSRARTSSATRSSRSRRWRSRSSASWSGATTCSSPASRSTPG